MGKSLPKFFANINTLLGKLNFNKFTGIVLSDLDSLLDHLDTANTTLFNSTEPQTKITLYLFVNTYIASNFEQIKRKSFPIDAKLF